MLQCAHTCCPVPMAASRQLQINADCAEEIIAAIRDDTASLRACQLAHPVFTEAARHRLFACTTVRALTKMQSFCSHLNWLKFNPHIASCICTLIFDGTLDPFQLWTRSEVDSCTVNESFLACDKIDTIVFSNLHCVLCSRHNEPSCLPGLQDSLT